MATLYIAHHLCTSLMRDARACVRVMATLAHCLCTSLMRDVRACARVMATLAHCLCTSLMRDARACARVMATLAHHLCTSLMRDARTCVRARCFRINYVFLSFIYYVVLQLHSLPISLIHLQNSNILLADDGHWPETFFNITWFVLAFLLFHSF